MSPLVLFISTAMISALPDAEVPRASVIVVVGAEGSAEYGQQFRTWAKRWEDGAKRGGAEFAVIGLDSDNKTDDRNTLKERLSAAAGSGDPRRAQDGEKQANSEPLWLILIGHGTFDGKTARFNLRGPDVSAAELAEWLKPIERPLAIVNCASSSGPFLTALSGPNRVVITATRSGHEYNFARFGDYLSAAISHPAADLDKDEQTSLLEAYLLAVSRTEEFYASDGRLVTEHALLDDNGDKLGTPADWFQGVRAVKSAKSGAAVDGLRAAQLHLVRSSWEARLSVSVRQRRDQLETELAQLRPRKETLPEAEYLEIIEPLLAELARLYESAENGKSPESRNER